MHGSLPTLQTRAETCSSNPRPGNFLVFTEVPGRVLPRLLDLPWSASVWGQLPPPPPQARAVNDRKRPPIGCDVSYSYRQDCIMQWCHRWLNSLMSMLQLLDPLCTISLARCKSSSCLYNAFNRSRAAARNKASTATSAARTFMQGQQRKLLQLQ